MARPGSRFLGFDPYANAQRQYRELARCIFQDFQVRRSAPIHCSSVEYCSRHLRPNFGWLEHVEIDMVPRCDDGSLPPNSQLMNWSRLILDATAMNYRPIAYNTETRSMLERLGFVDIQEEVIQVPLNPWPMPPHAKDIGRWYNLGLTQGLEAFSLAPLMRMKGWKRSDVDAMVQEVKREVCSKRFHVYSNM